MRRFLLTIGGICLLLSTGTSGLFCYQQLFFLPENGTYCQSSTSCFNMSIGLFNGVFYLQQYQCSDISGSNGNDLCSALVRDGCFTSDDGSITMCCCRDANGCNNPSVTVPPLFNSNESTSTTTPTALSTTSSVGKATAAGTVILVILVIGQM
jgi:hypothetical protein